MGEVKRGRVERHWPDSLGRVGLRVERTAFQDVPGIKTADLVLNRHGWGCEPNLEQAVTYLSAAASNAAEVENMALKAGLKKGGAAKGELVLAIFELANCFRHGWGVPKDPVAAKQVCPAPVSQHQPTFAAFEGTRQRRFRAGILS